MPKEISHWYLADRVKSNLPENSVFFDPVHSCENLFFLGAVAPDIPFYYLLGPKSSRIQAAAGQFHRPDAEALTPVLRFLEQAGEPDVDAGALSLAAGIFCHIFADTAFHPLVYYFSGMSRVHAGATARHRQFETALDLYFLHQAGPGIRTSLGRILSRAEMSQKRLLGYLGRIFALENPGDTTCLSYAVRSHVFYQALFQKKGVYRMLHRLNRGRYPFLDSALSLFYPHRQTNTLPFFDLPFEYRDPDTGQRFCAGITDLARQAEAGTLSLLARVSRQVTHRRSLGCLAEDDAVAGVRPGIENGRFWRNKTDLLSDLYHGQM